MRFVFLESTSSSVAYEAKDLAFPTETGEYRADTSIATETETASVSVGSASGSMHFGHRMNGQGFVLAAAAIAVGALMVCL